MFSKKHPVYGRSSCGRYTAVNMWTALRPTRVAINSITCYLYKLQLFFFNLFHNSHLPSNKFLYLPILLCKDYRNTTRAWDENHYLKNP